MGSALRIGEVMKKWKFVLEDGQVIHVIAPNFQQACIAFDSCGQDPTKIVEVQCLPRR